MDDVPGGNPGISRQKITQFLLSIIRVDMQVTAVSQSLEHPRGTAVGILVSVQLDDISHRDFNLARQRIRGGAGTVTGKVSQM